MSPLFVLLSVVAWWLFLSLKPSSSLVIESPWLSTLTKLRSLLRSLWLQLILLLKQQSSDEVWDASHRGGYSQMLPTITKDWISLSSGSSSNSWCLKQ